MARFLPGSLHARTALLRAARNGDGDPERIGLQPEALRIEHGPLRRGGRTVLEPAALLIPPGSIVAVAGANGAGKSTLFLALAGALSISAGSCRASRGGRPLRRVALVPQQPTFPPWVSGGEAAALHGVGSLALRHTPEELELATLLARPTALLSDGQTQTLAVALALLRRDPLVLLDEPFASVDLHHRRGLRELVRGRRERRPSGVVMLSSHAASDLYALCDWVITLRAGRYSFAGSRLELLRSSTDSPKRSGLAPGQDSSLDRFERRLEELTD